MYTISDTIRHMYKCMLYQILYITCTNEYYITRYTSYVRMYTIPCHTIYSTAMYYRVEVILGVCPRSLQYMLDS